MRALALVAAVVAAAATVGAFWLGRGEEPGHAETLRFESSALGRTMEARLIASGDRRSLLVLLHGRGGAPEDFLTRELYDRLEQLGPRAPSVLLVDGGDHSYFHDRSDGSWGTYVLRDAIPEAVRISNADATRIAIGGFSMGGFGALDLARIDPRFCAVGGHAPALWQTGGETPVGAFDDAEDFARHDLIALARRRPRLYGRARVWLDVGTRDPFRRATERFAAVLRAQGAQVTLRVPEGDHSHAYLRAHLGEYLAFYAAALEQC